MSFCCGASMIGTIGSLNHFSTQIHNVPLLFCPVCKQMEVHFDVTESFEILTEYVHEDGVFEVDFADFINIDRFERLFENCVNHDDEDPLDIMNTQIDMALDLWTVAKKMGDSDWQVQLIDRLRMLSKKREQLKRKHLTNRAV